MNLSKNCKLVRHNVAVAAGATLITPSAGVDTQGFRGCMFIVSFGTITAGAVTSIKLQQCDTLAGSYADLEGTSVTVVDTADDTCVWLDCYEPQERFLKCLVSRATQNAVVDGILAILYDPTNAPTTHDATTITTGEFHHSPDEGTA